MHDPTEGGVTGGIHEMADASNLGVKIFEEKIVIAKETLEICRLFQINPLCLIASGSLLIAAKQDSTIKIMDALDKNGVAASIIGELLPSPEKRLIKRKDGSEGELTRPISDHLWLALEKSTAK